MEHGATQEEDRTTGCAEGLALAGTGGAHRSGQARNHDRTAWVLAVAQHASVRRSERRRQHAPGADAPRLDTATGAGPGGRSPRSGNLGWAVINVGSATAADRSS